MTLDNQKSASMKRRTVLKSATAAASLALVGEVGATSSYGSVNFSEVGVEHDVSLPTTTRAKYPFFHIDEFGLNRFIDQDQSTLYINERYAQGELEVLKGNRAVVAGRDYTPLPTQIGGGSSSGVTTKLGENFRTLEALTVEDSYDRPRFTVEERDTGTVVATEGERVNVQPGSEDEIVLDDREVTLEVSEITDKDAEEMTVAGGEEWQKPWRKTQAKRYWKETVTVTPKVRIRNYGELDVVGVESKAPRYRPDNKK